MSLNINKKLVEDLAKKGINCGKYLSDKMKNGSTNRSYNPEAAISSNSFKIRNINPEEN